MFHAKKKWECEVNFLITNKKQPLRHVESSKKKTFARSE